MPKPKRQHFTRMTASEFRARAPERSVQSAVLALLRVVRLPHSVTDAGLVVREGKVVGRQVLADGWPDISAVLPGGRFLAIETKAINGRLRPSQIACHARLRQSGALVIVPRSPEQCAMELWRAGVRHPAIEQLISRGEQNVQTLAASKE